MSSYTRALLALALSNVALAGTAAAQSAPATPDVPTTTTAPTTPEVPTTLETKGPKEPKRGDFDAGGRVRLPNGPDEMGKYATFNWIAADLVGRYFLLDTVSLNGTIPLAVKKPDLPDDPRLFGGMSVRLDAKLPKTPKMPFLKYETELGLSVTGAYMREGAMLLSDKDFPMFVGDLKPGVAGTLMMKLKLSSILDFSLLPSYVFQSGTAENLTAIQVPLSLTVKAGSLVKLSADAGVFTGDNLSLSAKNGGRIYLGAAIDLKISRIITHLGAGVASLLTDEMGLYPTIRDSVYLDVNVKFAK
jgi:hypothetical protein